MMKGALLAALVAMAFVDSSLGFTAGNVLPTVRYRAGRSSTVLSSTPRMAAAPLNPPPGKKGGFLRGLKESIEYIVNGDEFIRKYTKEFGPIFSATIFFRPTVVVGGVNVVGEFLEKEKGVAYSSLPGPLQKLMTKKNVLLQTGEEHKNSRKNFAPILDAKALNSYIPTIEKRVDEYLDSIAARGETALAKDFTSFCLQLFAEIFSGEPLSKEEEKLFVTYNAGLFALTDWEPSFSKAKAAREVLETNIQKRFEAVRDAGRLGEDKYLAQNLFSQGKDMDGNPVDSYLVGFATTQFIWGAYIETASLMSSSIIALMSRPEVADAALEEAKGAGVLAGGADYSGWNLPYTTGILRECLRTMPPAGGGFRLSSEPLQIAGYDIPVGTVVTADPRIATFDATIFPEPFEFAPERWAPAASKCPMTRLTAQATNLPRGAWFPAGTGQHQCPGVPLAELTARIMLAKWVARFAAWEESKGAPEYILVPIKIPKDSYEIKITSKRDREA